MPDSDCRLLDDDGPYYWHIKSGTIQREPPENKENQPAMNFQRQVVREAEVAFISLCKQLTNGANYFSSFSFDRQLAPASLQWFPEALLASHFPIWTVFAPKRIWHSSIINCSFRTKSINVVNSFLFFWQQTKEFPRSTWSKCFRRVTKFTSKIACHPLLSPFLGLGRNC